MTNKEIYMQLFADLASENRCDILQSLQQNKATQTQISNALNLTLQETHRQTIRLVESELLKKNYDGILSLTPYGQIMTNQIQHYKFIAKYSKYFYNFGFGDIPQHLIQTISNIGNCYVVNTVTAVIEILESILLDANKYLKVITPEAPPLFNDLIEEKLERGFKIDYIFGKNTVIPKNYEELKNKEKISKYISQGLVKRKMLDEVRTGIIVTDKHAGLLLPRRNGVCDLTFMLVGESDSFKKWCNDFFDYQWEKAERFNLSKLNVLGTVL